MWLCEPEILALGKQRQEDGKFEASLSYHGDLQTSLDFIVRSHSSPPSRQHRNFFLGDGVGGSGGLVAKS